MVAHDEPSMPKQAETLSQYSAQVSRGAEQAFEHWRLRRLGELEVLDTDSEPVFDALAFAAAQLFSAPLAQINLVGETHSWNKAQYGAIGSDAWPHEGTLCKQTIQSDRVLVVEDIASSSFREHPFAIEKPDVRFYAGAPLQLPGGARVGTICVLDTVAREVTSQQLDGLEVLAAGVVNALESRHQAIEACSDTLLANERLANLYRDTPALFHALDKDNRIISVSDTWLETFGYKREQVLGRYWSDLLSAESARRARQTVEPALLRSGRIESIEFQLRHSEGAILDIEVSAILERDSEGQSLRSYAVIQDVTSRKRAERELARSRQLLQTTLESIGDAVITTTMDSTVQWMNPVAERLTGWGLESALGRPLSDVYHLLDQRTGEAITSVSSNAASPIAPLPQRVELALKTRDERVIPIEESAAPIRDGQGEAYGAVLVFRDVSAHRQMTREMQYRATHDALTGLVNRAEFEIRLGRILRAIDNQSTNVGALLFVDLDQFKTVNDICGHAAGDLLLQQISVVFHRCVRQRDTLARLGGDEFGLILEHCAPEHAQRIAEQICQEIAEFQFVYEGVPYRIGASIGMVIIDGSWPDTESLLRAADAACYQAKEAGRNQVCVWRDSISRELEQKSDQAWRVRIESAISQERLRLFAQQIVPLSGLESAKLEPCYEILLRMRTESGRLIPPGAFLPAAERHHISSRIDQYVIEGVIEAFTEAEHPLSTSSLISINLSAQSVRDLGFQSLLVDALRTTPALSGRLCIEVSETVVVAHLREISEMISRLQPFDVKFSIDDFGLAGASLTYLKSLRVNFLKLDPHVIKDVVEDPFDLARLQGILAVANVIEAESIAEAVEDVAVLDKLRELGVQHVQGNLIHQALPLSELSPDLRAKSRCAVSRLNTLRPT